MDKLKKLLSKCKCGVFITVNEHRDYYQTANAKLKELTYLECPPDISEEVRVKMIELDTIINIHFYPDTPIGFHDIYHWSLERAIDIALDCFND